MKNAERKRPENPDKKIRFTDHKNVCIAAENNGS